MLTLLRKIRRLLIDSGSARKYLLYAVGEILLVMIGILLALQVNTWNQKLSKARLETSYLKRLQNDLKKDSSRLNAHFELLNVKAEILKSILNGELDSIEYHNPLNSPYTIFATRSIQSANINTATFDDLISTGNIATLKDIKLRESIIVYYNITKRQEQILNNNLSDWARIISELIPGEMGLYARPGLKKPTLEQINLLKENLETNLERLRPIINAELNHTGLQYHYNMGTQDFNKKLLSMINDKLSGLSSK